MHASVTRRTIVSVGCGILIVGCGTPPVGSGGSGSGSAYGEDESGTGDDSDASDVPAGDAGETRGSGGRGTGYPGVASGEDDSSGGDGEPLDPWTDPQTTDLCDCAPPEAFAFAWIANPQDDTVAKVDVETMQIRGRYVTRDPALGTSTIAGSGPTGPVATSVSIDGRAVAVANIDGGLTKIFADPESCSDVQNTAAGLQTSSDGTALQWGFDECVAWHAAFDFTTQAAVAWGPGEVDPHTCERVDQIVWTAGCNADADLPSSIVQVDGDSGVVIDEIPLSAFPCATTVPMFGAVDREGSFWFAANDPGSPRVGRVSAEGQIMDIEVPPIVPSGLAIDGEGRVWISSRGASGLATAARYMPVSMEWDLANNVLASGRSGIVASDTGRMWLSYEGYALTPMVGGTFVEGDTMHVDAPIGAVCPSGGCGAISIDFAGRVWTTSAAGDRVHRYDPEDATVMMTSGMSVSSHGSDMTGWALHNAVCVD
jgi:hypothetical protein